MDKENRLEKFNTAIDEIASAKFILADVKIGKLISIMAEDDEIYHLLGTVLKGFDFDTDAPRYMLDGVIELPTKPREMVAFVFCLLVALHEKKFTLYDFLHEYFAEDNINSSYSKFVSKIIWPFRKVVFEIIEGEGEKNLGPAPKTKAEKLFDVCVEIKKDSILFKDCFNAGIILKAMIDACRREDMELFDALKLAMFCSVKNKKFIKFAKEKLDAVN